MKTLIATIVCTLITLSTLSQIRIKPNEYGDKFSEVYNASSITYYGMDFSQFILYNGSKVGSEGIVVGYIPAWIGRYGRLVEMELVKRLSKEFKKSVEPRVNEVQNRYKLLEEPWISYTSEGLRTEHIATTLKSYELKEKEGVGLVVIVDQFDKKEEKSFVDYVFFDIDTRVVLWGLQIYGNTFGVGMTNRWSNSLISTYYRFEMSIDDKIKKEK